MSEVRKAKHGGLLTALFSIISAIYVMPIIIVLPESVSLALNYFHNAT